MSRFYLCLLSSLLTFSLPAQNTVALFGAPNSQDESHRIIRTANGNYVVCGRVNDDAVLYRYDCAGTVLDSLRGDLSGVEDLTDVLELPNGEFIAVGYARTGNNSSLLLARFGADLTALAFDTLKINGLPAEGHALTRSGPNQWLVAGIVRGTGLDFWDAFTVRFNPVTLALTGNPAVFSYGVDQVHRLSTTSDGGVMICGSSFLGNVFDPQAALINYAFVRKIKPDGSLTWDHVRQQTVQTKYGQTYYTDAVENPASGNFIAAGRYFSGDTLTNFMDVCYTLLSPAGDSLDFKFFPRPGPENVYETIRTSNPNFPFVSVGDSVGLFYNTPLVGILTELDNQLYPLLAFTNQALGLSIRSVTDVPGSAELAYTGVFYLPGGPSGVNHDVLVATPPPISGVLIERFGNTLEAAEPVGNDFTYQWYLNGQPIAGATEMSLSIDPDEPGIYSVLVTALSGCAAGASYLVTATEEAADLGWRVYPNPFADHILVEGQADKAAVLSLCDATGRRLRVLTTNWTGGRQAFPLEDLPAGLYWLKLENERGAWVRKLVKH